MVTRIDLAMASKADEHYLYGEDRELIQLARQAWPTTGTPLPGGLPEVCRLARLSCLRLSAGLPDDDPSRLDWLNEADVLEVRAFCAATISGERKTIAGLMPSRVIELIKLNAVREGHQVL